MTFCLCMDHDHSYPGIKGQGQTSKSNFKSLPIRLGNANVMNEDRRQIAGKSRQKLSVLTA